MHTDKTETPRTEMSRAEPMATETTTSITTEPQGGEPDTEPPYLIARLSALLFLAFAIMGAWIPVFALHLKKLEFSPEATAWASGANAIGALLAPMLWGQIADRWLAMQRCISLGALATGIGLFVLAELRDPAWMIFACIAMWFFLIPTVGLSTSLIFRQLDHPERVYGRIRMWGTVGWVAASWCLTWWYIGRGWLAPDTVEATDFADSLRLGGLAALAAALYALTLPHTPPQASARSGLASLLDAPLSALRLFGNRSFAVYCVCLFGFNITLPFTIQLNTLLLEQLRVAQRHQPACLTIAQSSEVLFLYLLPILLLRFGTRPIMLLGCISWTFGLFALGSGAPLWVVLTSLVTHGVFICCFFIAGQVFVNRLATHDIRASAQGLLLLMSGSGLLLGNLLVGWIRDATGERYDFAYRIAAGLAGALALLFMWGFTGAGSTGNSAAESLVPESEMP
jgi:nucleoside transporter